MSPRVVGYVFPDNHILLLALTRSQRNLRSRSTVTIEDLDSKKGTLLNGVQIRGQKKTLPEEVNEVKLGMCPKLVRYAAWRGSLLRRNR